MQDLYHLEADLPSKDVKIKQLENTIEELQSELEMKSREIDKLKKDNKTIINKYFHQKENKTSNEEDSPKPSVHDDTLRSRNENKAKEMKYPKERDRKPLILPKLLQGDMGHKYVCMYSMCYTCTYVYY